MVEKLRVKDNDIDEITVTQGGKKLRGWSYANEGERRTKMGRAHEFAEGWYQATKQSQDTTRLHALEEALRELRAARNQFNTTLCMADYERLTSAVDACVEALSGAPVPVVPTTEHTIDGAQVGVIYPLEGSPLAGKYGAFLTPFVQMMESELHANAGKGDRPGWLSMGREVGLLEIYYHLAKLQKAVKDDDEAGIREYGADVANMAMMMVDICGCLSALAPNEEPGS